MPKYFGKNAKIRIKGYALSSYANSFETESSVNPIDVTGFTDGTKNFIPGLPSGFIKVDLFWSSTAGATHAAISDMGDGHITVIPQGYTLGNLSLSMPYTQVNYTPKGSPDSALSVGTIEFSSYGDNNCVEHGYALKDGTITNTTAETGFQVNASPVTAECSGTLHIWNSCAADTYVVKIQHCTTIDGVYADLITFTANGSAITSERQTVASGTINQYVRVLATRTGSAGNSFGFTVHYWQSV